MNKYVDNFITEMEREDLDIDNVLERFEESILDVVSYYKNCLSSTDVKFTDIDRDLALARLGLSAIIKIFILKGEYSIFNEKIMRNIYEEYLVPILVNNNIDKIMLNYNMS